MAAWRQISQRGRHQELFGRQGFRDSAAWQLHNSLRSSGAPQVEVDCHTSRWHWSLPDDAAPGRCEGYEGSVGAGTVSELCCQGHLYEAVEALGVLVQRGDFVSKSLFYTVLKRCTVDKNLVLGRRVHAFTVKMGHQSDTFLCNHILRMYTSHGRLQDAMDVLALVGKPDAYTWSAIISAHVKEGEGEGAIELYRLMRRSSVRPDGHVFVAALQACTRGADLTTGRHLHADVLASGVEHDLFVCNCLVDMYGRCGSLEDARRVFDGLGLKDVVTWNSMISAYSHHGMGHEAFLLYSAMQNDGAAVPDCVTFVCLLQACASVGDLGLVTGRQLHAEIREAGHQADAFVANSLVSMYAKCGSLEDARELFHGLRKKDVVTWNAMIAGCSKQGMGQEALRLYNEAQECGVAAPDRVTFLCLLQACANVGNSALEKGKQLHAQVEERAYGADVFVANSLVNMYAKCGSLEDAKRLFDGLVQRDAVTWNAMIAGFSRQGMGQEALYLYSEMQEQGLAEPDNVTFLCLLQACASVGTTALELGRRFHEQIREQEYHDNSSVASSLVNMYAKCGSVEDARRVFEGLGPKNVVTWTALISGYSQHGMVQEMHDLYNAMLHEGIVVVDSVSFVCLLQACSRIGSPGLEMGKQLHAQIRDRGLQADVSVASALLNMYAKCGSLEDAEEVFNGFGEKNAMMCNVMIAGYCQEGMGQQALSLYIAMQEEDVALLDAMTFVCLLQACAVVGNSSLEIGVRLHMQIRERGYQADVFVSSSLVNMYAKCGSVENAQKVFEELGQKNVVTYNAMIAGFVHEGMVQEALRVYSAMLEEGISYPDSVTFVCLLQAIASLGSPALEMGKSLHAEIRKRGDEADVFVAGSLISMYTKCGKLEDARTIFDGLGKKDVGTWNAMIAGFSQQGMGHEALGLYGAMLDEGLAGPDSVTFACLLQACASVGRPALEAGKKLHARIRAQGHEGDEFVVSSLVNMYAKCGSLEDSRRVFDTLSKKDAVTWTAMIGGYSQQGMGQEALILFHVMQEEGIAVADHVTFVCLLRACANLAALHLGRQLHAQIEEQWLQTDLSVAGSLINMYAKSGSIMEAQQVFDALPERDVISWSALIAGYTCQGDSDMVFELVQRMIEDGIQPVNVTFLSVLTVCSHAGLVNKGRVYFDVMSRHYYISPSVEHYTCMVDLLGRAGLLDDALGLVSTMAVVPNAAVWHTLMGACRIWSNVEVGRLAFDEAVKLDKRDASAHVLMSNIYSGAQMWEQAQEIQARRLRNRAWKLPGQSWWTDMDGLVHSFWVGRDQHLSTDNDTVEHSRKVSAITS